MMPFNTENNFDLICGAFSKTKVPHTKLKVGFWKPADLDLSDRHLTVKTLYHPYQL